MRARIWELVNCQCSLVGTCLSLAELKKIAAKTRLVLEPGASEYAVHGTFVGLCKERNAVSKAVDKALERKYQGALRRFGKVKDEAGLRALWKKAMEEGDVPGPYFACMTHPGVSPEFASEVFGHVHMLSHLCGAANRADVRRLSRLERDYDALRDKSARTRAAFRDRLRDLTRENRELTVRLTASCLELEKARQRSKDCGTRALAAENEGLRHSLASLSAMLRDLTARNEELVRRDEAKARRLDWMNEELAEKRAEVRFLEDEMERILAIQGEGGCQGRCEKAVAGECPCPGLCGKRILYVGGRESLACRYRAMVERHGGLFLRHDGGLEETTKVLPKLVGSADAVVCPVDCVSHDACKCVKEVCGRRMTPVKFLRSSGLSSLARALRDLADGQTSPDLSSLPLENR